MSTNAMTWLSRQIAWEARLAELRDSERVAGDEIVPQAA